MTKALLLIACLLPVAACNKGPEVNVKNASVEEVANKLQAVTASESLIQAGRWESKVTLLDMQIPGMPPQVADRMKQTMAKVQNATIDTCLTQADVKRPKEDFFAGKSKDCRYDHFTMSGGKIDAVMQCKGEGGSDGSRAMTMTIKGTYSPDRYEATMAMDVSAGHEGGMKMKSHTISQRVGECRGDEGQRERKA